MVLAASKGAKNADSKTEASAEWKDKVETTIKRVFERARSVWQRGSLRKCAVGPQHSEHPK
jgi:hypothetical protein